MKITKLELEDKNRAVADLNAWKNEAMRTIAGLREAVTTLTKERDSSKQSCEWYMNQMSEVKGELEQVHALLDVFPSCLPRESAEDSKGKTVEYSAMTRLASWLVNRGALAAPDKASE